ncbi:fatty acid desaturase family protein [Oxynema aestuarii]|jgi:fatty acid desaturase|uniref:Fatty acid desaturase domain-containing protein n=1 Tax=Oxynema aestuarii AP17 TaxID=2064643 RepID=A0A6H1U3R1_9CYAN|nr:fatty acid desaturase [Oxynema aestuarii]QIZ72790.1 hypothetical protein HCG48_21125 [Oxynema aestuarii AP17]RMH77646.1 MAG: hypothetical protein D6680_04510 [Cyanobacteria bacterium J007]
MNPTPLPPPAHLDLTPPERLNIALSCAIVLAGLGLQWGASHVGHAGIAFGFAIAFSFLFLPLYSLLHEAEHNLFHRHPKINNTFGFLLAAFFPGSFTFLRSCHLGHHRRNRTDAEMFDLYYPTDNLGMKRLYFYSLYLGLFWLAVPVATIALLIYPKLLQNQLLQDAPSASAMINGLPTHYLLKIRLECLAVIAIQVSLFFWLDLQLQWYLLLYACYGLNWSSQQYINHAHSPRHVLNGAHNLKAHGLYQGLLLNFNWHLAHHQYPNVPWIYLPQFDDINRDRPGYLTAFIRFWAGPQPCQEPEPKAIALPKIGREITS